MSGGNIFYPNVTSLPGQTAINPSDRQPKKDQGVKGEFDQVFEKEIGKNQKPGLPGNLGISGAEIGDVAGGKDLSHVKEPLKFSAHASQRLKDRKITLDAATMAKVSEAVDKAESKGIDDTLVLTKDAALIVSVKNRTVITALDKNSLSGNVFTNIDGAVIV